MVKGRFMSKGDLESTYEREKDHGARTIYE